MLETCSIVLPSAEAWKESLAVHVRLVVFASIPLGAILYKASSSSSQSGVRKPLGILVAVATGLSAPILALSYLEQPRWIVSFLLSTFGFSSFFKAMNVAFETYPDGADRDYKTWILWFTSRPEPLFVNGALVPLQDGDLLKGILSCLSRGLGLSLITTILMHSETPFGDVGTIPYLLNASVYLWLVYTFVAFGLDFGAVLVMIHGYKAEATFDNPLLESRTYRECWSGRWNKPVQLFLKRTVYVPARRSGIGPYPAALLVFGASGLLHEYNFYVHNNNAYEPGHAVVFFFYVGMLMLGEELILIHKILPIEVLKEGLPSFVISILMQIPVLPVFSRLFVRSWLDSGMLDCLREMMPHIQCQFDEK